MGFEPDPGVNVCADKTKIKSNLFRGLGL